MRRSMSAKHLSILSPTPILFGVLSGSSFQGLHKFVFDLDANMGASQYSVPF
jgi:hypothetical protein